MRLLDEQYTRTPYYGIRRMTWWLKTQGRAVNAKRVRRLLRLMGLEAIYPKPRLSAPAPGTPDLPVPVARSGDCASRSGLGHGYHLYPAAAWIHLSGGDHGLVQPVRAGLGSVHDDGQRVLRVGAGLGADPGATRDFQLGSGRAVHQRCLHAPARRPRHHDQHGRPGPVPGQHLRRALMANGEVRGSVPEGLLERSRGDLQA